MKALRKSGISIERRKLRSLMTEENLKAIQAKVKTIDSKETRVAGNLLTHEAASQEVSVGRIIIGDRTYICLSRRQILLLGNLAEQSNAADHRVEFGYRK